MTASSISSASSTIRNDEDVKGRKKDIDSDSTLVDSKSYDEEGKEGLFISSHAERLSFTRRHRNQILAAVITLVALIVILPTTIITQLKSKSQTAQQSLSNCEMIRSNSTLMMKTDNDYYILEDRKRRWYGYVGEESFGEYIGNESNARDTMILGPDLNSASHFSFRACYFPNMGYDNSIGAKFGQLLETSTGRCFTADAWDNKINNVTAFTFQECSYDGRKILMNQQWFRWNNMDELNFIGKRNTSTLPYDSNNVYNFYNEYAGPGPSRILATNLAPSHISLSFMS